MKIEELGPDERPREKLIGKGSSALSNAELLAILIRSGTRTRNALDVGRELLKAAGGSLSDLSGMSLDMMTRLPGVGATKASAIAAAFEIGRRFALERTTVPKEVIDKPWKAYSVMIPYLKALDHEECWCVFLNRANFIISRELLSRGGLHSTVMDTVAICTRALEKKCSSMILVHNHPSGNPRPSNADIARTDAIRKALSQIGISLLDHIVVCDDSYYSFSEERVFEVQI